MSLREVFCIVDDFLLGFVAFIPGVKVPILAYLQIRFVFCSGTLLRIFAHRKRG